MPASLTSLSVSRRRYGIRAQQQDLIPILVASIKEQQTQLNALKAEIELLINKIMDTASKEEFPRSSESN